MEGGESVKSQAKAGSARIHDFVYKFLIPERDTLLLF